MDPPQDDGRASMRYSAFRRYGDDAADTIRFSWPMQPPRGGQGRALPTHRSPVMGDAPERPQGITERDEMRARNPGQMVNRSKSIANGRKSFHIQLLLSGWFAPRN